MHRCRRRFIQSGLALVTSAAGAWDLNRHSAMSQTTLTNSLDKLLQAAVTNRDLPGVVALITDSNRTLYEGAFGERAFGQSTTAKTEPKQNSNMTIDSVMWIASMTKPIVAAAAMQLVEAGKLELDAPVSTWLPQLGQVKVLAGFDSHGQPILKDPTTAMTLRHLLTHTAGFTYDLWDANLVKYHQITGKPRSASGKKLGLELPLAFDPGTQWEYGINYDWIGQLIEAVSQKTLGEYIRQHITAPLGMVNTGFKINTDMRKRLAKIHQRDGEQKFKATSIEIGAHAEFESGGAGLYSTARDYAAFMRMILNKGSVNGHQILKPETVALMTKSSTGDLRIKKLQSQNQTWSRDIDFFPGLKKSWGLGFMINEEPASTGRSAGSLAWAGIGNTFFWVDPEKNIAGLMMTQLLPFLDQRVTGVFNDFERNAYQTLRQT